MLILMHNQLYLLIYILIKKKLLLLLFIMLNIISLNVRGRVARNKQLLLKE